MKKFGIYLVVVLTITIFLPTVVVKTFKIVPKTNEVEGKGFEEELPVMAEGNKTPIAMEETTIEYVKVYNTKKKTVETILLDDYVKGVVAAEMPAEFHIEALKAQAVAARTLAIYRSIKYKDGHSGHKNAPLCSDVHCQAYLSLPELQVFHGDSWVENYWGKIEEAVDSTKGLLIYYDGEIIEPLYHSTSGGMTEDAIDVFATDSPYLKSVISPYEEVAPRYKSIKTLTGSEFIGKLNRKYPDAKITKDNFADKIKLIEKTESGRVKKIAIDNKIINGREIRDLFELNSTNFVITYNKNVDLIEITTYGYGHGVGMSQWGANGMAKNGSTYIEILKHYYTDVEIR